MVGDVRDFVRPSQEKLELFKKQLFENQDAIDYLKIERGLAEDTIKYFNLGYDSERNAIAIPNFKNGELINIMYRHLVVEGKQSKYSQEKDGEVWVYNDKAIDLGLKKGAVLVVEGQFDCMSAYQAGIKNVISVGSGKNSLGIWLELLDPIPETYICFDNDKAGKDASYKFAERIGVEKSKEVLYPEGIKDANEFFKSNTKSEFLELIKNARPFYTRKYNDLLDVINLLRLDDKEKVQIDIIPDVRLTQDHLLAVTGSTGTGKTMYVLNIAKRLAEKDIPCLILPFERGIQVSGERFLQIISDKTEDQMKTMTGDEWDKLIKRAAKLPIFFSLPNKTELVEVLTKAKRILGVKAVIVDHLDYMIRNSGNNEESEIRSRMHELKTFAIENEVMVFVVTHPRRTKQAGSEVGKKPTLDDIRGSSSVAQDSETVIILDKSSNTELEVDVQKNKGIISKRVYTVDYSTGLIGDESRKVLTLDDF